MAVNVSAPSIDSALGLKLLPVLLSLTAGSADVISFLGFRGLFVAHITGNLIILASRFVTGARAGLAPVLSVPTFIVALALTRLLAAGMEARGIASLRPLLVLQFLLLAGFLTVAVAADAQVNPYAGTAVLAALLGVCAMAVQNALVQISLQGAPTTAVMTTNITRFTMDAGEVLLGRDPAQALAARRRLVRTWWAIAGFSAGAAAGAALFAATGLPSLAFPAGLALLSAGAAYWGTASSATSRRPAASIPRA